MMAMHSVAMVMTHCRASCMSIRVARRVNRCGIHRGRARYIVFEVRARGNQIILDTVASGSTGPNLDAGRIDSLLVDQVELGVDGTFRSQSAGLTRVGIAVTDQDSLSVGLLLEIQSDIIQAGLGFVVHAGWATLVAVEVD